jgi:hypothetical protein
LTSKILEHADASPQDHDVGVDSIMKSSPAFQSGCVLLNQQVRCVEYLGRFSLCRWNVTYAVHTTFFPEIDHTGQLPFKVIRSAGSQFRHKGMDLAELKRYFEVIDHMVTYLAQFCGIKFGLLSVVSCCHDSEKHRRLLDRQPITVERVIEERDDRLRSLGTLRTEKQ